MINEIFERLTKRAFEKRAAITALILLVGFHFSFALMFEVGGVRDLSFLTGIFAWVAFLAFFLACLLCIATGASVLIEEFPGVYKQGIAKTEKEAQLSVMEKDREIKRLEAEIANQATAKIKAEVEGKLALLTVHDEKEEPEVLLEGIQEDMEKEINMRTEMLKLIRSKKDELSDFMSEKEAVEKIKDLEEWVDQYMRD